MSHLVEVPVAGGRLLVQAANSRPDGGLDLAAPRAADVLTRAKQSLEDSLDELGPAVTAISQRLKAMTPDAFSVEFGLIVSAEAGLVVAKGTAEVNFTVTLSWERAESSAPRSGGS